MRASSDLPAPLSPRAPRDVKCPGCQSERAKVLDSRQKNNRRYRKRECADCGRRYTTTEMLGEVKGELSLLMPMVEKQNGKIVPFDRDKLMRSITVAVHRSRRDTVPINDMANQIEQEVASLLGEPMPTFKIGEWILQALHRHDKLAYVRYLSVHQKMETAADIRALMGELQRLLEAMPENDRNDR